MTDADLIHNACLRAQAAIIGEVKKIDAKPWWLRCWVSNHKLAALYGAAMALCALREEIASIMSEEGR